MHKIRFSLGLRPFRPRWRSLQGSTRSLAVYFGQTEGKGRRERGKWEKRWRKRDRPGRGGKGRERRAHEK